MRRDPKRGFSHMLASLPAHLWAYFVFLFGACAGHRTHLANNRFLAEVFTTDVGNRKLQSAFGRAPKLAVPGIFKCVLGATGALGRRIAASEIRFKTVDYEAASVSRVDVIRLLFCPFVSPFRLAVASALRPLSNTRRLGESGDAEKARVNAMTERVCHGRAHYNVTVPRVEMRTGCVCFQAGDPEPLED